MIEMKNVTKKWKEHKTHVLDEVSFKICERQSIGLMGSSGCGKSTLARILCFWNLLTAEKYIIVE